MIQFRAGTLDFSCRAIRPVIAVDIGFSRSSKTTGMAWTSGKTIEKACLQFGRALEKCIELIVTNRRSVLIVEAPLSVCFNRHGNPEPRLPLEKRDGQTRYWYAGPGASTCLAGLFLLHAIREAVPSTVETEVFLIEGLVSFKTEASCHDDDAARLLSAFLDDSTTDQLASCDRANIRSLTSYIAPESTIGPAPIIVPR